MRVGNFITDNSAHDQLFVEGFLLGQSDLLHNFEIFSGIRDIPDPAVMSLGDYQSMARCSRANIEKGEEVIVFIDNISRYFFLDDFTEDAVFHNLYYIPIMLQLYA